MIVRIVKMTFQLQEVDNFKNDFEQVKTFIRGVEGCLSLSLNQSIDAPNVFFTYSHWESESHLEAYRNSELFKQVWTKTKPRFLCSAEAWSCVTQQL